MINQDEVLEIHKKLIDEFGGESGIRDFNLLISALNRPFQTFNKKELYPTPQHKAAAIIESILVNHPFIDGNKRTGYFLMRSILLFADLDITANEYEKYDFVIKVASGVLKYEEIVLWINKKTASRDK